MDYIVKAYKDWKLHSQFQEIVPDMDDEYLFNEKQSIRDSARSLKKYGSTCCNHMRNNETLVRHEIEKTDTLQGIALKYGCTTEQIRRVNRLFASDSLFLRQYLMVPIEKSSPYYVQALAAATGLSPASSPSSVDENNFSANNVIDANSVAALDNNDRVTADVLGNANNNSRTSSNVANSNTTTTTTALPARPYSIAGELLLQSSSSDVDSSAASNSKQSKSLDSVAAMTPDEENRKCINDFLNKIDATITESRKYVEKSKEMITSQSDNDLFVSNTNTSDDFMERNGGYQQQQRQHHNNSYRNHQQHHMRQSSSGSNNSDTAYLLNTTQLRRVQNSLKRMEKQQDEFFEL